VRGKLTFPGGWAAYGAVDVNIGHNRKATLKRRHNFGGSFWTIIFHGMQHRQKNTRLADGFISAFQAAKPAKN
jgi:hypothetical protein